MIVNPQPMVEAPSRLAVEVCSWGGHLPTVQHTIGILNRIAWSVPCTMISLMHSHVFSMSCTSLAGDAQHLEGPRWEEVNDVAQAGMVLSKSTSEGMGCVTCRTPTKKGAQRMLGMISVGGSGELHS
jgi:hypothetical protein